jgi:hypothetical protein
MGEYLQKWSMTLAMFGRCRQSGYNLATIQPTIQLIFAIKQGLSHSISSVHAKLCQENNQAPSCLAHLQLVLLWLSLELLVIWAKPEISQAKLISWLWLWMAWLQYQVASLWLAMAQAVACPWIGSFCHLSRIHTFELHSTLTPTPNPHQYSISGNFWRSSWIFIYTTFRSFWFTRINITSSLVISSSMNHTYPRHDTLMWF